MVTDNTSQTDDTTAFLRAARSGNLEKVIEYLDTDLDINTANSNGLNALHLASKDGHVEIVTELLKRGAKVDAATKKGNTALHISSLAGQTEIVNILIQYGAAVNIQSQNGFTPLYMAAQENHDQVVKLLLSNGANQSLATEDGFTPLAVAMQQGHEKVVSVLLENDSKGKVRLPALHIAAKKDDCKAADLLLQNDHKPDVTSKSGFTPLHIAAHYGNEEIARLLIKRGADVNYLAKHNISPLHVAAKWGKNNMVKILLENSAMIDAKTRDGLTPLHCAARSGHEEVVTTLLEHEAPISARTKNGLAPLHMASQGDHVDAARVLLYHRAPVDEVTIDYLTSLHVAAHCGHVRVAKLLLDRKADPNARALNGFTPLHIACKKNRIKVVELLLKHGASIESTTESGLTPLHVASFMGCMNIVIFLLQHEANPDVPTVRGETPLHLAARANQTDIIRILLRNGAKVDARAREEQTPLHIASRLGNVDIVMLLLQHGAAVDTTTKDMYTALHIAAKEGQEEVAAILVENHASVKAATKNGFTPLHIAAKYGNMNVAKILLQKDSKLDAQGKNDITPLHLACHYDHSNVANMILEKGASPHLASQNGHTPLHIAARKNQMDIASTLLEHGADPNVQSKAGFTPLQLSAQKGHYDMTNLLIEHGADPNHKAKNGLTALHLCAQEDFIRVASILVKNGANVESETETGYRPIHVAAHFGNLSMIRFLLKHNAQIDVRTNQNYTPLHQAAQQGHAHIVSALLEGNASHNARTTDGLTALNVAQKLGYISVMEVLKGLSYDTLTPDNRTWEEKYKVIAPESLQETSFMSDSDDEGGSDGLINEQPYRYLTADLMKSLRDDSLPIDVTRDDPIHRQVSKEEKQEFVQSNNYCLAENFDTNDSASLAFLVSFLVDARGGAMKGCRHSGIRIIVPPRRATMPIRVTCRLIKPSKVANPPSLMEGEALATRIIEMGPVGASFLGPVLIDVPHFASIQGKEREIIILRSENGETWKEHDNTPDNDDTLFNTPYGSKRYMNTQMSASHSGRITRILTMEYPQYFAIVTRIKQEVHVIGADGGILISSVANHVQAVFPPGALTKKIKVGLQAHVIPAELTAKLLGNCVAVSPVITIEPRRRKFHKPITLTIPVPQAANKGMINQYGGETPTLRLLCSIAGGTSEAQWEDVTGSTPLTFMNDKVSFTTTVSARFWLMDCRNISEVPKMATELYKESLFVPFITNFVIYTKRLDILEATLRILCMTDGKEGIHTLERQEEFLEIVKSRDVEALDGKDLYIEFSGNLVPVTKSGVQLKFTFKAFRQNRLSFHVKVRDPLLDPVARMMFMRDPKVAKGEPSQQPICVLNIVLPDSTASSDSEKKLNEYEDSNLKGRKEDRIRSSFTKDEDEKGDKPKPSSPSESKFIIDILEKEQTDAATIHESFAQKAACPLESVDASYPSNVSVQDELSPEIEKQTYTEKRKFWEDITRKRENYQRSESELSRTSQLTVNESDSECCIQNIVSEEETAEAMPGRSETMEDMNIPDISECSVAEKANYFEKQIQKELSATRPNSKLITQESLKDKETIAPIRSKIASELSTEKPERVEQEEVDPKSDKQDWNLAESMKKEKHLIVSNETLKKERISSLSDEKIHKEIISTIIDEKISIRSDERLQKEMISNIIDQEMSICKDEKLQKEFISSLSDEKLQMEKISSIIGEKMSIRSDEKLQKERISTFNDEELQKEMILTLGEENLEREKMSSANDEKLPKETKNRESLEMKKSEVTMTKTMTDSRTELRTEITNQVLVEKTNDVQKEIKTEIELREEKCKITDEKPEKKIDEATPSIIEKESVFEEAKKNSEKTKIPSKIPELKKSVPHEFDAHRKIYNEFLHHETTFSHAELESAYPQKPQISEKQYSVNASETSATSAISSSPEEATKTPKEDLLPSMIPRKIKSEISGKEAKKVPVDETIDKQESVEPLVGLTAEIFEIEREVTPVDKESTSPSEKITLKMQEEAKTMKKESRIPISLTKADKEKTLKAKEEILTKSPVSPDKKLSTKLERRLSDEEATSSKEFKVSSPKDSTVSSPKEVVTSPKKEFESRIPKRTALPKSTQEKKEVEKMTETVTETKTMEKFSSQHYQKHTSEIKTKTVNKSFAGQSEDAGMKFEETERDSSVVTSKIDHRASTETTKILTSDPTMTPEKIVKHEETEHKRKEKLSETTITKYTPQEIVQEKQSESLKSELSAAEEISMILKDGREAVEAKASQLNKMEKEAQKSELLTDERGTFIKVSELSSVKERELGASLKIEREEPINLEDEMKNAAVKERQFEETLISEGKRVFPSELKSEELASKVDEKIEKSFVPQTLQERQEQMIKEVEARNIAETIIESIQTEIAKRSASLDGIKQFDTSDSDSKEYSENILDMDTTESEVFHDRIAEDLTKKLEDIMDRKSRRHSQVIDENDMLPERLRSVVVSQDENIEKVSNRGSISISEDLTKDEESTPHDKEESFPSSSEQHKLMDRDITVSPSSISDQMDLEVSMDSEKSVNVEPAKQEIEKRSLNELKPVKEFNSSDIEEASREKRNQEIPEPVFDYQSRQDSIDVSSLEIDEPRSFGQQEFVDNSSSSFERYSKETVEFSSIHESPAIESLDKICLDRDITLSPSTVSEDTNVDFSLVQDQVEKRMDCKEKLANLVVWSLESEEIESPPVISPRLKLKELEIKPVNWMIGDEKIEVSEPLQPSQAFDKELEEYQTTIMRQQNETLSRDESADFEQESGTRSSEDVSAIDSVKETFVKDSRTTTSTKSSKFTVTKVNEPDFDSELVENRLDISCQELVDTLQREYEAKTPTEDRKTEGTRYTFDTGTSDLSGKPEKAEKSTDFSVHTEPLLDSSGVVDIGLGTTGELFIDVPKLPKHDKVKEDKDKMIGKEKHGFSVADKMIIETTQQEDTKHEKLLLDSSGAEDVGLGTTGELFIDVPQLPKHDKVKEDKDKMIGKEKHGFSEADKMIIEAMQQEDTKHDKLLLDSSGAEDVGLGTTGELFIDVPRLPKHDKVKEDKDEMISEEKHGFSEADKMIIKTTQQEDKEPEKIMLDSSGAEDIALEITGDLSVEIPKLPVHDKVKEDEDKKISKKIDNFAEADVMIFESLQQDDTKHDKSSAILSKEKRAAVDGIVNIALEIAEAESERIEDTLMIASVDEFVTESIVNESSKFLDETNTEYYKDSSVIVPEKFVAEAEIVKEIKQIVDEKKFKKFQDSSTVASADKIETEVITKGASNVVDGTESEKLKDSSSIISEKSVAQADIPKEASKLSQDLKNKREAKDLAQEMEHTTENVKLATRPDEAKTNVSLKGLKQTSPNKTTKSSLDESKKQTSDSEMRDKSGDTSAFKLKKEDLPSVDLSARYAITVLDQVVKKEIAEVKESLEAAKQDLIEELNENSETVFQIKDSPSEFQFKLEPETIPNDLPFLYKAPSIEQVIDQEAQPSAEASPVAKPRKHADAKDVIQLSSETESKVPSTPSDSKTDKKIEEIPETLEPSDSTEKIVQIETKESEKKTKITVQRDTSGEASTETTLSQSTPVPASRTSSDVENKEDGVSLLAPQPVPRRRQKPARTSRKLTSESDAGSSSGDSSNYQSCDYDIGSGSRPSSSDIEALQSTLPSGTISEYESALMSIEHSTASRPTSQEYQSAASTLSSRESMKSLNSLSSGHLGSIDSTGELSETLVASETEDDDDKDQIDENLECNLDEDHQTAKGSDSSGSEIPMEDAFDKTNDDLPCRMKRSSEMIFQQIIDEAAAEEAELDEEAGPEEETRFDECTTEQLPSDTLAEDEEAFRTDSIFMSTDLTSEAYDKSLSSMESKTDVPEGQIEGDIQSDLPLLDTHLEADEEADSLETKQAVESSLDETAATQASMGTLLHQASTTSSTSGAMSFETVIEKDQKIDRHSPDSDSFELIDKPDIIDDFVVIEEVGREAEEFDSEGKSISIGAISYTSVKKYDRELENLITENKEEQVSTSQMEARNNELFDFESEESPPQASNDDQYSQSLSDDENFEGSKKWVEMQFQNDPRGYDMDYDRGRLEDIKEEEITDFEAGSSRFGSLGSHKGSIGSVGSMRGSYGSTTEYDVLAGKKCFSKPAEHDNVSLSSLQEFEHLETAVALENSKKLQCGSQDSVNNGSLPRRYMTSRSGHGDDVSLSSLKDFEGLEKACREAHLIELRAREEEDLLDHESPENRYKLENLPRPKPAEPLSAAGSFNPSTSGSDDYEKRIMEIDEIIRIAQANVEKFDRQDDTTEDISQIEITGDAEKIEAIIASAMPAESDDTQQALRDTNVMETSTDSLELEENADKKYNPLCRSSDSLEMKTTIDFPSLSSDSLNNVRDSREAPVDPTTDLFNSGRRISSDSLEMPLVEQQDPDSQDKSSGSHGSYHVKDSFDDSVEQTSTDTKITNNVKTRSPSTSDT